jgi:hypothetical protein
VRIDRRGYRWYKKRAEFCMYNTDGAKTELFSLVKINPDGTVIESSSAQYGYPDKVEPVTSPNYGIGYRRK